MEFICPQCNLCHTTTINNSMVVCTKCILNYGLTDFNGESMTTGFRRNNQFYSEVNGNLSDNRECCVNDKRGYIMNTADKVIFVVLTKKIIDLKIRK